MSVAAFPADFARLETQRLVSNELTGQDGKAVLENYSNPDSAGNFLDAPFADIEQAKSLIDAFKADTLSNNARSLNLLKRLEFQLDDVRDKSHFSSSRKPSAQ